MGSVAPITLNDLNGISLNPTDLATDELVGYVGYVRNLCTNLGTKNDSKEGWDDWVNFKAEIDKARISTFTPDSIDETKTFETMDLTGDNLEIPPLPITLFAMWQNALIYSYAMNNGRGATPFDIANKKDTYVKCDTVGVTPFDLNGGIPIKKNSNEELVLTA